MYENDLLTSPLNFKGKRASAGFKSRGEPYPEDGMYTSHPDLISTSDGAKAGFILCRGSHLSWLHSFFSTGKIIHSEYIGNLQHHFKIKIEKKSVLT